MSLAAGQHGSALEANEHLLPSWESTRRTPLSSGQEPIAPTGRHPVSVVDEVQGSCRIIKRHGVHNEDGFVAESCVALTIVPQELLEELEVTTALRRELTNDYHIESGVPD